MPRRFKRAAQTKRAALDALQGRRFILARELRTKGAGRVPKGVEIVVRGSWRSGVWLVRAGRLGDGEAKYIRVRLDPRSHHEMWEMFEREVKSGG
jgi:hypothetical protein